jgi:hypothetical protein
MFGNKEWEKNFGRRIIKDKLAKFVEFRDEIKLSISFPGNNIIGLGMIEFCNRIRDIKFSTSQSTR